MVLIAHETSVDRQNARHRQVAEVDYLRTRVLPVMGFVTFLTFGTLVEAYKLLF